MQFFLEFLLQHLHLHLPQQLQQPQPTNPVPRNAIKPPLALFSRPLASMYTSHLLPPPLRSPSLFPPELYFSNRMPRHRALRTKCQYRTSDIHHLHAPLPLTCQALQELRWRRGLWLLLNNPKKSELHGGFNDQSHALTTTCTLEVVFVLNIKSINTRMSSVATFHSDQLPPSHPSPPKHLFQNNSGETPTQ